MRTIEHRSGCNVALPDGWEQVLDPHAEVAAYGIEPEREHGAFRANLVLTITDTEGADFAAWQNGIDQMMPKALRNYRLLDLERCSVAGRPGGRRLANHIAPDGSALTMEQWVTKVGNTGYTLTFTVDTWRYDAMADEARDLAATLRVPERDAFAP